MGYWRGRMFNMKAASRRSMPDRLMGSLPLKSGDRVADIGAGGGYFTLRMAEKVGRKGSVYAVDTDQRALSFIRETAQRSSLDNVEAIFTNGEVPGLPAHSMDLVLMRNVCHHITDPVDYFRKLRRILKKNGTVAIIDYDGSRRFSFHGLFHHSIEVKELDSWMREAGYRRSGSFDFLPEQSFTLFRPREGS